MRLSLRTVCCSLIAMCFSAHGQEALPRFEVASIKVAPDARGSWNVPGSGGRLDYRGDSLKNLIAMAWSTSPDRISGGPGWAGSTRYDVLAKAEEGATRGMSVAQTLQYDALMMRALLIDRFHLAVHVEARESPIYALVIARKDGKLGPALKEPQEGSCVEPDLSQSPASPENGKFLELSCGLGVIVWNGRLRAAHIELTQVAEYLSRIVDRPVVDETNLQQKFDVDMEWNRPQLAPSGAGVSIFTALEEQLGLKLEPRKGLLNFVVIDRAESPTEN